MAPAILRLFEGFHDIMYVKCIVQGLAWSKLKKYWPALTQDWVFYLGNPKGLKVVCREDKRGGRKREAQKNPHSLNRVCPFPSRREVPQLRGQDSRSFLTTLPRLDFYPRWTCGQNYQENHRCEAEFHQEK